MRPQYLLKSIQTDPKILEILQKNIEMALVDDKIIYEDWDKMRESIKEEIKNLNKASPFFELEEVKETQAFLHWIRRSSFYLFRYLRL